MLRAYGVSKTFHPSAACRAKILPFESCGIPIHTQKRSNSSLFFFSSTPFAIPELSKGTDFSEFQFGLSNQINFLFEKLAETDAGVWLLNTFAFYAIARMVMQYGFFQPSVMKHYQDRYSQTWMLGNHIYGSSIPNPLRK
jgi:hypothetical protein